MNLVVVTFHSDPPKQTKALFRGTYGKEHILTNLKIGGEAKSKAPLEYP